MVRSGQVGRLIHGAQHDQAATRREPMLRRTRRWHPNARVPVLCPVGTITHEVGDRGQRRIGAYRCQRIGFTERPPPLAQSTCQVLHAQVGGACEQQALIGKADVVEPIKKAVDDELLVRLEPVRSYASQIGEVVTQAASVRVWPTQLVDQGCDVVWAFDRSWLLARPWLDRHGRTLTSALVGSGTR
jgi:hypothetical protein